MTKSQLFDQIKLKNSYLCVGLDTDIQKIPKHLLTEKDPIFESYANFWYEKIPDFSTHNSQTIGYQAQFNQYNPATNIAFGEGIFPYCPTINTVLPINIAVTLVRHRCHATTAMPSTRCSSATARL